jgi:hypothetical protein
MALKFSGQTFGGGGGESYIKFDEKRPLGAELFDAGGRTDRQADTTKLTVGFGSFAKAPKYQTSCPVDLL